MPVTIGADPEILLLDRNTGNHRAVVGLVGGTKEKPIPIVGMESHFPAGAAMQEDNVMLEFNTVPAVDSETFQQNVRLTVECLDHYVLQPLGLSYSSKCYGEYSDRELASPQAQQFGCSPDMDAYLGGPAKAVLPAEVGRQRFAGGHVHLGYSNPAEVPEFVIVQLCDAFLGLAEVRFTRGRYGQGPRRQTYGTAGRYRPKPYGVEYRTLSNSWLWDYDLQQHIAGNAFYLAGLLDEGNMDVLHRMYTEIPIAEVQTCINREDSAGAERLHRYIMGLIQREAA